MKQRIKKTVSDIVTIEKFSKWQRGDIITITAGTGMGKSYFIMNNLCAHAKKDGKKILLLVHRLNCFNQFLNEIIKYGKTDIIDLKTYQSLEIGKIKGNPFDVGEYKYIVCDEFHYFMSDAAFNKYTDISLDYILAQRQTVRIFMSATGEYMKAYINEEKELETIDYEIPVDFSFIKTLKFFNQDSLLEEFIQRAIEKNTKAIFFIESAKKAYELWSKYKDYALFNCSKTNKDDYYKYVDKEAIDKILKHERFDKLLLITTMAMDTGVNIKDREVKRIVCDVKDTGTLIQCIGRKRIMYEDDEIYLYVKGLNNNQLGGMKRDNKKIIEKAEFLRWSTVQDYILQYPRDNDHNNIVYNSPLKESNKGTLKVNELMYFKRKTDNVNIDWMLDRGKHGYHKFIRKLLKWKGKIVVIEPPEVEEENAELERYLEEHVGEVMYTVADRKELIEMVNVRDGNNNRLLKNINTLNGKLKEIESGFTIDEFRISKTINGNKRDYKSAWRILRLCEY